MLKHVSSIQISVIIHARGACAVFTSPSDLLRADEFSAGFSNFVWIFRQKTIDFHSPHSSASTKYYWSLLCQINSVWMYILHVRSLLVFCALISLLSRCFTFVLYDISTCESDEFHFLSFKASLHELHAIFSVKDEFNADRASGYAEMSVSTCNIAVTRRVWECLCLCNFVSTWRKRTPYVPSLYDWIHNKTIIFSVLICSRYSTLLMLFGHGHTHTHTHITNVLWISNTRMQCVRRHVTIIVIRIDVIDNIESLWATKT